jgi:PAS domain S-box-containing protein
MGGSQQQQASAEASLPCPERHWRAIFDGASLGIAQADCAFRLVSTNAAFRGLLGYSSEELQRRSLRDLCIEEERQACESCLRDLGEGVRSHGEFVALYRRKDGTPVPVSISLSVVADAAVSQPTFLAIVTDITGRRLAEEARDAAQSELARASRLTTMGAMTASIAHELNQPLAAIVANGHASMRWLSRDPPDVEEARAGLKRIVRDGHRASEVIASIRAMFGKDRRERVPVRISDLVSEVIVLIVPELKNHRISLALELVDDLERVLADRVQLQQVLLNLLTNAIEAMSCVADRARVLRVRSESLPDWVLISIQDSGSGISPENAERVFEAFFTTKANGMGLGLSICRSIVEAHGGWLSVSPTRPHGAAFEILLPAATDGCQ